MTAVSISVSRGVALNKITDFTVGTSAPGAGDIEIRFNVLDAQSHNMNIQDEYSGPLSRPASKSAVFS